MKHLICSLAVTERPYEKALLNGIESLSDSELLAIILRTGTKDVSALDLANQVLDTHITTKGLLGFANLTRRQLCSIKGIGDTKATQLLAVTELSKRISNLYFRNEIIFDNPATIADYYIQKCKFLKTERTVNASFLSPREIMIEALKREAVHFIIVHNHPSGNPEPSEADILITKKIHAAGELMDVHLSDHIIIGNGCYVSLLERGYI